MPQLGESIAEATIVNWLVKEGAMVEADQDVVEVETNKATMNVTAPCRGRLEKWVVKLNESYAVGAVLGQLEVTVEEMARMGLDEPKVDHAPVSETASVSSSGASNGNGHKGVQPTVRGLPVPAHAAGASYMSPRMKARMNELGLHAADLAGIAGSGAAGRVTIQDFEAFIANLERAGSPRHRACGSRWRMRCGGAGHGLWPQSRCRCAWIQCWRIGSRAIRNQGRPFTLCEPWQLLWPRTARLPGVWWGITSFIRRRLMLGSPLRRRTAF